MEYTKYSWHLFAIFCAMWVPFQNWRIINPIEHNFINSDYLKTEKKCLQLLISVREYYDFFKAKFKVTSHVYQRLSMISVPPLGFDPYCEGKLLPLQNRFTPSIKFKKMFTNRKIQFTRWRLNWSWSLQYMLQRACKKFTTDFFN